MGAVWRGRHRHTGTPVALKVLLAEAVRDPWYRRAFNHEIRAVAALDHPAVVRVFDRGRVPNTPSAQEAGLTAGSPFLVMELLEGGTLRPLLGQLTWLQIRWTLLRILDGLAHAHAHGVLHRDIKPANLLLDASRTRVVLTDFGIARPRTVAAAAPTDDWVVGTPTYMAPEQARGRWRDQGPWTDLYALGCLAWALLTGRPPRSGAELESDPTLRARPLPQLLPAHPVPNGLGSWLRKMLASTPRARFQRAPDAAWELLRLAEPETTTVTPVQSHLITLSPAMVRLGGSRRTALVPDLGAGPTRQPPERWTPDFATQAVELSGEAPALVGLRRMPLLGREALQDTLWQELILAIMDRQPRAVVVRGAPGLGRTTLLEWLGHRVGELGVAEAISMAQTPSSEAHEAPPGSRLAHALAQLFRCADMPVEQARRQLDRVLEGLPLLSLTSTELDGLARIFGQAEPHASSARPPPFPSPQARHATLRRLLQAMADLRPRVLLLDDVHEDPDGITLARRLVKHSEGPLLVVLSAPDTTRPAVEEGLAQLLRQRRATALTLTPLDDAVLAQALDQLLRLDPDLRAQVLRHARGNPQLATTTVRAWRAWRLLVRGRRGHLLNRPGPPPLPNDISAAWRARLDRFLSAADPSVGLALEVAAHMDEGVRPQPWQRACAEWGFELAESLQDGLLDTGLGVASGDDPASGWHFAHPALVSALQARAAAAGRSAAHHRALLSTSSQTGPTALEQRAHHHHGAGELDAAVDCMRRAVLAWRTRGEYSHAGALLDRWQVWLRASNVAESNPAWGRLALERAEWTHMRGNRRVALATARDALEGARSHGWPLLEAVAMRVVGTLEGGGRPEAPGHLLLVQAVGLLEELDPRPSSDSERRRELGLARVRLAASFSRMGHHDSSHALCTAALADFEAAEATRLQGIAALNLGRASLSLGRREEGERWLETAQTIYAEAGDHQMAAVSEAELADLARKEGRLDDAQPAFEHARSVIQAAGRPAWIPLLNLTLIALARENWQGARLRTEQMLPALRRSGEKVYASYAIALHLVAAARLQRWDDVAVDCGELETLLDDRGAQDMEVFELLAAAALWARESENLPLARRIRRLAVKMRPRHAT